MSNAPTPAAAATPKKRRGIVPILVAVFVVAAAGGGGYAWWSRQHAAAAASAHGEATAPAADTPATDHGALLSLDTFTVNLADTEATRFLRTTVQIVVAAEEEAIKELEHEKLPIVRARSAVLELLSQQTSGTLSTPDGKTALKKAIAEKVAAALHHEVTDVLFSDFVIQY